MTPGNIIMGLLLFGFLVIGHEAGHYAVARWCGIAVDEFSVGFGPRLYSRHRGATRFSFRLLPLGGYVRWREQGEPGAFAEASLASRAMALVAGPAANFLAAYALFYGASVVTGVGWAPALTMAGRTLLWASRMWVEALLGLVTGQGGDLIGPIGVVETTAQTAALGLGPLLGLSAFLSLNLGLFNLLPLPFLDGGRLGFLGLEALRRRPVPAVVEGVVHATGFLLFLALTVWTALREWLA